MHFLRNSHFSIIKILWKVSFLLFFFAPLFCLFLEGGAIAQSAARRLEVATILDQFHINSSCIMKFKCILAKPASHASLRHAFFWRVSWVGFLFSDFFWKNAKHIFVYVLCVLMEKSANNCPKHAPCCTARNVKVLFSRKVYLPGSIFFTFLYCIFWGTPCNRG